MPRLPLLLLALIGGVVIASAPSQAAVDDDARRLAADKNEGRGIYQTFCVSCHGQTGAGEGPAAAGTKIPNFTTPKAVVAYDLDRMVAGIERQHAKETKETWRDKIPEADLKKVVAYMREAFMLPAPTEDASRGRAIFARTCSVCHGDRGNGASWARNSLNPSPYDFSAPKAKELSRRHMINTVTYGSPKTAMMGFSTQLSREDIAAVVDYIRATFIAPQAVPETGKDAGDNLSYGNRMLASKGGSHAQHGGHAGPADMTLPFPDGLKGDAKWGKTFFNNNCYVCHGKEGKGDGPRAYFIQPKPANLTSPEARSSLNRPHLFKAVGMGSNGSEMPAWSKVLSEQEIANVAEYVFITFIAPAEPAGNKGAAAGASQKKNN